MTSSLAPRSKPPSAALGRALPDLAERVVETAREARAPNTQRAYASDWRQFQAWCDELGVSPLPAAPQTIALFLQHLADEGLKVSSLARKLACISSTHRQHGHPPVWTQAMVRDVMKGLRRTLGEKPTQKLAIDNRALRRLLEEVGPGPLGVRDRAMLLLGWAAALRRSELVGLRVGDLVQRERGVYVTIRRSKTDQTGKGEAVPVFYGRSSHLCPVKAVEAWVEVLAVLGSGGPEAWLWPGTPPSKPLSVYTWVERLKRLAEKAGLDPAKVAGHSLRRGFITTAAREGKDIDAIMVTSRHRTVAIVRGYIERETLFDNAAGEGLL